MKLSYQSSVMNSDFLISRRKIYPQWNNNHH